MPKVIFNCPDGSVRQVEAQAGRSLMELAKRDSVPGILAECGGAGACATCHVYVSEAYMDVVGKAVGFEEEMLDDSMSERLANSRLACQVKFSDALDGVEIKIAARQ